MAKSSWDQEESPIVDINITPFVDVVLVLLVIFMVTAPLIHTRGLDVELPDATTAEVLNEPLPVTISVDKGGQYYKDGKLISLFDLQKFVAGSAQEKPSFIIAADKQVAYDYVIGLMDVLRQQGVTSFALQLAEE